MTTIEINALKYPIGEFTAPDHIDQPQVDRWIDDIQNFPDGVEQVVKELSPQELAWPYRPQGWTISQVVHHCADSHMNAFIRFKLALTEENATIRPYFEARWAELPDSTNTDIGDSINILHGLHNRWVKLLRSLSGEDLSKTYFHPEHNTKIPLKETIGNYSWHCRHHMAHINQALRYKGSF